MKVKVANFIRSCPQSCDDFKFVIEGIEPKNRRKGGSITVVVDCAHSAVCKFRWEGANDGEIPQETR